MSSQLPVVIYVGGYSRSGSTLLDLVLSDAFGAFGGGELTRLLEDWDTVACSCGEPFAMCGFWGDLSLDRLADRRRAQAAVEARPVFGARRGATRRDVALHADTTRRVFAHLRERSGASVVVDSSKSARGAARRAQALADAGLDVRFVHLLRSPYSVASSYRLTGSNRAAEGIAGEHRGRVARAVVGWSMANAQASRDAASDRWPAVRVAYEDLAREPDVVVGHITAALGLGAPRGPVPDHFGDARGHAVAGNRMRRSGEVVFTRRVVPTIPADCSLRDRATVRAVLGAARADHGYSLETSGVVPTSLRVDSPTGASARRVAHVCTRFATGGSERRIVDAMAATPEMRHRVYLGPESNWERAARDLGGAEVGVLTAMSHRTFTPVGDLRALRSLRADLSAWGPDVVHTVQSKAGMIGRLAAPSMARRVHSVSALNFGSAFAGPVSALARKVEELLARKTDDLLVAGDDLKAAYTAAGIASHDRLTVTRATVDLERITEVAETSRDEVRDALGLAPDRPVVAFVGRLERRKGVHHLAVIMRDVVAEVPDAMLVVAGAGPEENELLGALADFGPDAVVSLGYFCDVPALLRASDCVVLPSLAEGISQVLVQASLLGRPFVSFDVPGAAELLRLGAIGSIVSVGDETAAAREIVRWIRSDVGPTAFDGTSWSPDAISGRWREALTCPQ
ncbi:MAG: glycosyltransferase [Acidimicrobiales bacterium]